ncbi:MAG: metal ABC transporter permease [Verrucomicrobiales bacterium]
MTSIFDFLGEPFDLLLYQRALLATLVIGFANGYTSAFVLLHRSPLKLTALSHSLLPGIAFAAWFVGLGVASAFVGSVVTALAIGGLTLLLSQKTRVSDDTVLAVLYTGAFALGIIVLNKIGAAQELDHWLLGNILGLSDVDLWMSFIVGVISVAVLTLFQRAILLTLFEPQVARSLGVPVKALHYGLFALLIFVLVTTLQAVGCILAIGLIVTPAATVRPFTNSARTLFLASGLLGALASALGLWLSYRFDQPAGASIVVTLSACYLASALFSFLKRGA